MMTVSASLTLKD